jgi:hypothetical protein
MRSGDALAMVNRRRGLNLDGIAPECPRRVIFDGFSGERRLVDVRFAPKAPKPDQAGKRCVSPDPSLFKLPKWPMTLDLPERV